MIKRFHDPLNLAAITTKDIIEQKGWIGYVIHDSEDGGWQFLEKDFKPDDIGVAAVVSLQNIIDLDPSIEQIADLPLGWCAWRGTESGLWQRAKMEK